MAQPSAMVAVRYKPQPSTSLMGKSYRQQHGTSFAAPWVP